MPKFRSLDDLDDVRGKRVLLRADLNVPIKDRVVTDATRIERLAPTIEALIDKGAKVIVMSHFGRPKGKKDPAFSLRPLVAPLSRANLRFHAGEERIARMPRSTRLPGCCRMRPES
jgi:phosphoglycerate kinase